MARKNFIKLMDELEKEVEFVSRGTNEEDVFDADVIREAKKRMKVFIDLKSIKIPKNVVRIGDYTLSGSNLKRVRLPKNLEIIGDTSFAGCEKLAKINIPNSVQTIGEEAFLWCEKLKKITIPNSVKTVGCLSFGHCYGLQEITIDNSEEFVQLNWHRNWRYKCNARIIYLR